MQKTLAAAIAATMTSFAVPALGQFSVGTGFEYTRGDYGKASSTEEWKIPVSASYRSGPWSLRLGSSWMRVKGVASALDREAHGEGDGDFIGDNDVFEGDDDDDDLAGGGAGGGGGAGAGPGVTANAIARDRRQSGFGDATASVSYNLLDGAAAPVGLDLGARVKFPLASGGKCLLTNGATDYSVQAEVYQTYGNLQPSATLGWTKRGDPDRRDNQCNKLPGEVDLRDPIYAALSLGIRLSESSTVRVGYEFREKLRATSDPKSEATLSYQHRLGEQLRVGFYGVAGFTDASPDWGLGASVAYRF